MKKMFVILLSILIIGAIIFIAVKNNSGKTDEKGSAAENTATEGSAQEGAEKIEETAAEEADAGGEGSAAEDAEGKSSAQEETAAKEPVTLDVSEPLAGLHHAELVIKDYGTISLELDADTAPITVTNFVKLAQEGFYDGLTFHRIMKDFMMQGGDPLGNGTGGSKENIKGEFQVNGIENPISHERGVISMARSSDFDSASSQFFIMHKDTPSLDGKYAAFGHVTDGMKIVDKICEKAKPINSNGLIDTADRPVIETIRILD